MTSDEEFALFRADYPAWLRYVAARWIEDVKTLPREEQVRAWQGTSLQMRNAVLEIKAMEKKAA